MIEQNNYLILFFLCTRAYSTANAKMFAGSRASFMTAVISLILGIIAFAFGLTSLILVQKLRSTVDSQLGKNILFI